MNLKKLEEYIKLIEEMECKNTNSDRMLLLKDLSISLKEELTCKLQYPIINGWSLKDIYDQIPHYVRRDIDFEKLVRHNDCKCFVGISSRTFFHCINVKMPDDQTIRIKYVK